VLKQGEIASGTTVLVERDAEGDEEERPLKLKLVKPRKKPARKKQPAGVGGRGDEAEPAEDEPEETAPETPPPSE
jgi:hypothetical protein